jgi:hypothetical protein
LVGGTVVAARSVAVFGGVRVHAEHETSAAKTARAASCILFAVAAGPGTALTAGNTAAAELSWQCMQRVYST